MTGQPCSKVTIDFCFFWNSEIVYYIHNLCLKATSNLIPFIRPTNPRCQNLTTDVTPTSSRQQRSTTPPPHRAGREKKNHLHTQHTTLSLSLSSCRPQTFIFLSLSLELKKKKKKKISENKENGFFLSLNPLCSLKRWKRFAFEIQIIIMASNSTVRVSSRGAERQLLQTQTNPLHGSSSSSSRSGNSQQNNNSNSNSNSSHSAVRSKAPPAAASRRSVTPSRSHSFDFDTGLSLSPFVSFLCLILLFRKKKEK